MTIISGIGVRRYYKKRGYKLEDTYMKKILDFSVINHNNSLFYLVIITVFISILANVIYFIIWK